MTGIIADIEHNRIEAQAGRVNISHQPMCCALTV
jgi:hypothetical protein